MKKERMKRERITEDEMFAAARKMGVASLKSVNAIILETDGTLTVIKDLPDNNNYENLPG